MKGIKDMMTSAAAKFIRGCMWLLGRQPLRVHYFWSDCLSWFFRKVAHYREDVVYTNLAWAFPEMSYGDIRKVARSYYDRLADIFVEALWFGGSSLERLHRQRIVEFVDVGPLHDAIRAGRSAIILNSHCGNWELMGGFPAYVYDGQKLPIDRDDFYVVYKKLKNPVFDKVFYRSRIHPIPDHRGVVESSGLIRFIVSHRNRPSIYLIFNDQYPRIGGVDAGIFLNQPTTAFAATAAIASRLGMSVLFMRMDVAERGRYEIRFETIAEDASTMTPEAITREYVRHLEQEIREQPHNWLWSHKRWKNKENTI